MKHSYKWIALEVLTLAAIVGAAASISISSARGQQGQLAVAPDADLPLTISLPVTIRDFRASGQQGGHPDFQAFTGTRATVALVQDTLGQDGKPVLANGGLGKLISSEWRDSQGRNINPAHFNAARGDVAGTFGNLENRQITSEQSFASWYSDAQGVNQSKVVGMTLNLVPGTNRYVFDSAQDAPWNTLGGFFPINGELFGNYADTNKNFHFTTQLEADFIYRAQGGQVFTFSGDDDVWVFIDGKLVIDLGGLHPRMTQTVELDRLSWLENGRQYRFKIFHAERRTTQSNFRMETTIQFSPVKPPQVTGQFD
jgi:fibro-slime domain-containing protein